MSKNRGLILGELLVIVAIVILICAIAIPGLISSQRASNERGASASLNTLTSAEADFRANDRDGNGVNDFWTADVKSLYTLMGPDVSVAPNASTKEAPVMLIDKSVAAADGDDTVHQAGGKNTALSLFATPSAKAGFWFAALLRDTTVKNEESAYRADTGGKPPMGKVHHTSKFGFVAFPDSWSTGRSIFRVNENNTIYREALTETPRKGASVPPGLDSVPPKFLEWSNPWPNEEELRTHWTKIE